MTSITDRIQLRLDRADSTADPAVPVLARRILTVSAIVSAVTLLLAIVGLLVDQRMIGGAPAWLKPMKFGVSITLYLVTVRVILNAIVGHRRLLTVLAGVLAAAFALETLWIDVQVLRGTTSHFNQSTPGDGLAFDAAGGVVSMIFLATIAIAVLALRTPGLDAGIGAGIRWGLLVALVGMADAISMLVNGTTATTSGAHTVGAPDGGPGLPLTDWSLAHGDLRIGHFVGLHALQLLPLIAWALRRWTRFDARTRRDLVRVAGVGMMLLVVLVWWQAERGQALLDPDALTLGAAAALVGGVAVSALAVIIVRRPRSV